MRLLFESESSEVDNDRPEDFWENATAEAYYTKHLLFGDIVLMYEGLIV